MAEAYFSRTDTAEGARFDVTPAPKLAARSFAIVFGGGLGLVILFAATAVGSQLGFLLSGFLWVPLIGLALVSASKGDRFPRVPTSLLVNAEGIKIGSSHLLARDIVEFLVQHPHDDGGRYMKGRPSGSAAQIGQAIGNAQENRSFALMARLKSSSRPHMLVYGLTYNTGTALMNDVHAAMR